MTQAELTTARLRLRPLADSDVDALVPIYTDTGVTLYFRAAVPDRAAVAQTVRRRLTRPVGPGMGSWVMDFDGVVVGLAHVWPSQELPGRLPEMGWMLAPAYWGRGLATEAAAAVLDHARYRLGLPAVWALVHRENKASLAVAGRLGMRNVGEDIYHGAPHRVFVAPADVAGAVHHIELRVPDLDRAQASIGWLLGELGWSPAQNRWHRGGTSVVIQASPDGQGPGLNHLALHAGDPARVDALVAAAVRRGWRQLSAAHLADPDGFEIELVATEDRSVID